MKKDPAAVKLGKKGAAKRNANMSPKQKSEAARNASNKRWRPNVIMATVIDGQSGARTKEPITVLPNGNHAMGGVEYDALGIVVRNAKMPRKKRK